MQKSSKELVLVGGGHSHVEVLRQFGMNRVDGARVTLVSSSGTTPYSGMLPGFVAGHYSFDDIHIDLVKLCQFAGARLFMTNATGVDVANSQVLLAERPPLAFDFLSLNTGSAPDASVPGAREFAIPVKPIAGFVAHFETLLSSARAGTSIGIVGAGAGGVELALALSYRMSKENVSAKIRLLSRANNPTSGFSSSVIRSVRAALERHNVELLTSAEVVEVKANGCLLHDGRLIETDHTLWCLHAGSQSWFRNSSLPVDGKGFARIKETLQLDGLPNIFAVGDNASLGDPPLPKAGVFAVRQGPVLARNLRRAVRSESLEKYRPQSKFLSLLATGEKSAILSRGSISTEGASMWRLKDRIDRKFMRKYVELPSMEMEEEMLCAGCGSKLGSLSLDKVLGELKTHKRSEVVEDYDTGGDSAVTQSDDGVRWLHSLDGFTAPISDPFVFGRLTAHHALSDIYASGGEPVHALALVTVPTGKPKQMESDLRALLAGANSALVEDGVALIGGHTTQGETLSFALSVTGKNRLAETSQPKTGDVLILTKPLGTGLLFAGLMRGATKGGWLEEALSNNSVSQKNAAGLARSFSTGLMTDVTGFGFAVHLSRAVKRHGLTAQIPMSKLPVLRGAVELAREGVRSSLAPDNEAAAYRSCDMGALSLEERVIVCDPQTAGGLLFSVSRDKAEHCIEELNQAGVTLASVVGFLAEAQGENHVLFEKG